MKSPANSIGTCAPAKARTAVALALDERPAASGTTRGPDTGGLTPRQREVAALVAQGMTDREIAGRLVISPRTAESHVESILTRLGFRSRSEIAAWTAGRAPEGKPLPG